MKRLNKRGTVVQFTEDDYIVLNYEQLLKVNGAKSSAPSAPSGGPSSSGGGGQSSSSSSSGKGDSSSGQSSPSSSTTSQTETSDTVTDSSLTTTETTTSTLQPGFVANSNEAIANANVGDKITRNDGTVVTLKQGDINYAKEQIKNNPQEVSSTVEQTPIVEETSTPTNTNNNSNWSNTSRTPPESQTPVNIPSIPTNTPTNTPEDTSSDSSSETTEDTDSFYLSDNVLIGDGTSTSVTEELHKYLTQPSRFDQRDFNFDGVGKDFGSKACAATSLLNEISEQYSKEKGEKLSKEKADKALLAAVEDGHINSQNATVNSFMDAANAMAKELGLEGTYSETTEIKGADVVIYAVDSNPNEPGADHFVNSVGYNKTQYYDPWTGAIGNYSDLNLDQKRPTRLLSYSVKEQKENII